VRTALRRWACVLAVGGAVLAETAGAGAGAVNVAVLPARSTRLPMSDSPWLTTGCAVAAEPSAHRTEIRLADLDLPRTDRLLSDFSGSPIPVASFLKAADEKLAANAVSFPTPVPVSRARSSIVEPSDADDGGTGRIPPAAMIPLPAGVWTGIGGLGGLALISAAKRAWKMR
jgi:hypothetical protein